MKNAWNWFINGNSKGARCARTIVQGVLGLACSVATYYAGASEVMTVVIAPLVMVVLSPIMALLSGDEEA